MPIQECQLNGEQGYKWGEQGKCYTGPNAKEKAIKQGIAIGEENKLNYKIKRIQESLKIVKIGFDYDDTLTLVSTQDLVKRLISSGGNQIFIISARNNAASLYPMASKLGIPMSRVYAVGSNEKKVEKIKELGLDKFYDNNPDVISKLPGIGVKV
jgi:hypothetical protein